MPSFLGQPNWFSRTLACLALVGTACGGVVEEEPWNDSPGPPIPDLRYDVVDEGAPSSDAEPTDFGAPDGDPGEIISKDETEVGQPGQPIDGCGCDLEQEFWVQLISSEGVEDYFSAPPSSGLAPGSSCAPLRVPAAAQSACEENFSFGACNEDEECLEVGFSDDRLAMNLWRARQSAVTSFVSHEWELSRDSEGGIVRGSFFLEDTQGRFYSGKFSLCLIEGSVANESCVD